MTAYKIVEASGRFTFTSEYLPDTNKPLSKEEAERLKEKLEECVPFQLEIVKIDTSRT